MRGIRLFFGLALAAWVTGLVNAAEMTVDQIIDRVLARTREVSALKRRYAYEKETRVEQLDGRGKARETTVKEYEVTLISGIPYQRLRRINGQALTGSDLEKEKEREERFRSLRKTGRGERQDMYLTEELAARFHFKLIGEKDHEGRSVWALQFSPKDGLKENALVDRFINRIGGQIWVDKEDFEIAFIRIGLLEKASLWGGFLGSLERFTLIMSRTKLPDGMWMNAWSDVTIQGRKFLSSFTTRVREQSSGYRRDDALPTTAAPPL